MSTDVPFTPHADSIQTAWVLMCQQSRITTQPPVDELEAEFNRFIAKVRRDAAREALDGLARRFEAQGDGADMADQWAWEWHAQSEVEAYRDAHYPEEETP